MVSLRKKMTDISLSSGLKIQQTKMLITCLRFGDLVLFGLVWQYSTDQNQYNKGIGSKSWLLTCSSNTILSLPSYIGSDW